jgi:very-short-patch-repair endonuclease
LAEGQHGVVARAQLLRLGVGRRAIEHRLQHGRLHPIHHGVYAVGHRVLSKEARWMAAVLAAGPGAALSHRSAAALWGLRRSTRSRIEVTVATQRRPRPGIQMHRGRLAPDEVTVVDGIPVTTVLRTLLDLAAVIPPRQVERAVHEAEVRRLSDLLSLDDLVVRHPRRRRIATIRAVLAAGRIGAIVTRSELEDRFLAFVDAAGLPRPEVNTSLRVGGRWIEADCVWRAERLIVELDGHATHGTAAAYERDRARDRTLNAAGWRVVRVTWRQTHDEPNALAADLRTLLTWSSRASGPRDRS